MLGQWVIHSFRVEASTNSPPPAPPAGLAESFVHLADRVGIGLIVSTGAPPDPRSKVVYANAAVCRLLGATRSEFLGLMIDSTRLGSATFECDDDQSTAHDESRCIDVRGQITREDGQHVFVRWSQVRTGTAPAALVVHFLVPVERVIRVEQALHDSEQRFRRLIDIAPDGILVLVGKRVVYANQAITKIHGYSNRRQFLQLTLDQLFDEEDRAAFERGLTPSAGSQALLLRAMHRDGSAVPVEVVLFPTEWDERPAVLAAVRDLAGRRLVQNQLVHTERLAAVGTLAAGVAHEINNPLAYVLLNLQYLIREVPKYSADAGRVEHLLERLREARHGAERVVSIVKDLRAFSRVDDEHLGPVDLRRVLLSAIKVARAQLGERGQIVEKFASSRAAFGNATRLEQVFLNLLINAIQSLVGSNAETNRVFVRSRDESRASHDFVIVEITDNGSGISPENLTRIFDPFFTTKPVGLGTGLGLPICNSIVNRMGGDIEVTSAVGSGTTVSVALPVAPVERLERIYRPSPTPAFLLSKRARILIVDDELPVAAMLSRVLGEEHDVEIASSAEQALGLMDEHVFDVIFCDLLMPDMTGMDLYAEVAHRFPGREKRIAFMTGGAFTARAAHFLCHVSNPRLEKPFDLRAMRSIVRDLLQGSGPSE